MNTNDKEQASQLIVEICDKVIVTLATENKIQPTDLIVRVDLENTSAKPVFGVFENSKLIAKPSLNEVIRAGGGQSFAMVASMYVRNIIKDIFVLSMQRFELKDSKKKWAVCGVVRLEKSDGPTNGPLFSRTTSATLCVDYRPLNRI